MCRGCSDVAAQVVLDDRRGHPALEDAQAGLKPVGLVPVGFPPYEPPAMMSQSPVPVAGVGGVVVVGLAEGVRHLVRRDADRQHLPGSSNSGMVNSRSTNTPSVVGRPPPSVPGVEAGGLLDDAVRERGLDGVRPGVARVAGDGHVRAGVDDADEVDDAVAVVVVVAEVDRRVGLRHGLDGHAERAAAADADGVVEQVEVGAAVVTGARCRRSSIGPRPASGPT